MAIFARPCIGIVAFLMIASGVHAFGRSSMRSESTAYYSYYYVVPLTYYWYYCPPRPMVTPVPDAIGVPAPPSQTPEPPLQKMMEDPRPKVITSRSSPAAPTQGNRCRVGFWNITGRDVTLTIDGKTWTVLRNRSITVETGREFAWRIDQQTQRTERVADGLATYEVVVRE